MDQDGEEVQDIAHHLKAILDNPDAADDDNNKDVVEMDNAPSSDNKLESTSEHPLLCMLLPLTYKQSLYHINEPTSAKQQVHQVGQAPSPYFPWPDQAVCLWKSQTRSLLTSSTDLCS
jgi:hypothetical protein